MISTGRFYSHGKWVFWDVRDPEKAIVNLRDERYDRLVIDVDDPDRDRPHPRGHSARHGLEHIQAPEHAHR